MKVSELTLDIIKQYLRIDGNDDDILLNMFKDAAIKYCASYMGCDEWDLENYPDVTVVVLSLISDSYEVRQFTTSTITTNPIMLGVLDLHCGNFLVNDSKTSTSEHGFIDNRNNTPNHDDVRNTPSPPMPPPMWAPDPPPIDGSGTPSPEMPPTMDDHL